MSISSRVTVAILSMALLLGLTVYGLQRFVVYPEFKNLEQDYARLNIDRIASRFIGELASIDATVYDWSAWNDTYAFAQDRNTAYIRSNLYPGTFYNFDTDIILFINLEQEVLWAGIYDFQPDSVVVNHTDERLADLLSLTSEISQSINLDDPVDEQVVRGLITFFGEPVMFAMRPIYSSHAMGSARGFMLMGRTLHLVN